jgi:hypothetical protein
VWGALGHRLILDLAMQESRIHMRITPRSAFPIAIE